PKSTTPYEKFLETASILCDYLTSHLHGWYSGNYRAKTCDHRRLHLLLSLVFSSLVVLLLTTG
ncbi:uncharacterized protein K441DRAFT_88500, partial [Cenococcum geophilum 1.58]|uniref:uncharacterized protein n=1 Tax=Cenococcum geophilum 1.58 TaxID=794803 RepID=UPI00358E8BA1